MEIIARTHEIQDWIVCFNQIGLDRRFKGNIVQDMFQNIDYDKVEIKTSGIAILCRKLFNKCIKIR